MSYSTQFHDQLMSFLRQYSRYRDLRHIKALAWMVSALICSGKLSQPAWEPYVPSRAKLAQSFERRWQRFLSNTRHLCELAVYSPSITRLKRLAVPPSCVLPSIPQSYGIALCMIHLSVVCCGRAVPFLWRVLEHNSAAVAFDTYRPLLRRSQWL
ncbi:hypothetical protein [Moorena sp. SIO4G3]|uniref:hypothetical protein n=1 Tax=Moorena sp. SIO4G3 TaxID=2607821 RepID=UPI0025D50751|nr:hypothetical protein [Moorena sp. SIO4G3]